MWGEVFKELPAGLTREEILFFDAVDLLAPMARLQYDRMVAAALEYSRSVADMAGLASADQTQRLIRKVLITDAAGFVVAVQRLRRVVKRLRGDKDLRLAKTAFEAKIRRFEQARHYLEHLDTAIPKIAPTGHGALGALSWWYVSDAERGECMAIAVIPGHLAKVEDAARIEIRTPRALCDHFIATIAGAHYELSQARDAVVDLESRLHSWSQSFALPPDAGCTPTT
jgi:hypothetical protein